MFVAVGVATENFGFKLFGTSVAAGVVTTSLAFGLVLMALAYAIGPISGCHVNPAVTVGFIATGRMKLAEGAGLHGGPGGWRHRRGRRAVANVLQRAPLQPQGSRARHRRLRRNSSLVHLNQSGAFVVEVILTFIFVTVILFATHKAAIQGAAGLAIGMSLVVVHLIGIPLTGTSVNPARSLGPALIVGGTALSQVWLFLLAPLVGAVFAAIVHLLIAGRASEVTAAA